MFKPPGECPVCGEDVHKNAKACPECGADANSGWKDDGTHDGLDLPDGEFDYDNFVAEEFGKGKSKKGIPLLWWIVALVLILLFIWELFQTLRTTL